MALSAAHVRVLLVAHGSRDGAARTAMEEAADGFRRRHPDRRVSFAFLESAEPALTAELEKNAAEPGPVWILPLFLAGGAHVRRDLPDILQALRDQNPPASFHLGRDLGDHPALAELALLRLRESGWGPGQGRGLWVAHGAPGDGCKERLERLMDGAMKKDPTLRLEACFIGTGRPSLAEKLAEWKAGDPPWGIAPFLLFPGAFLEKVRAELSRFQKKNPSAEIFSAEPLGAHDLLFQALDDRCAELSRRDG